MIAREADMSKENQKLKEETELTRKSYQNLESEKVEN